MIETRLYFACAALLIGTGATLLMDLWGLARQRWLGLPLMNYGLVGRWLLYLPRGKFIHRSIGATPALAGEALVGWIAHYLTGIAFAAAFLALCGMGWARQPTLAPALLFGLLTVAAPFLILQPGMGAGLAARRTPKPQTARLQSLLTHAVFGLGLYLSACLLPVFA